MEIEKSVRYRVNVTQTSTGKKGFECTVELVGYEIADVLTRSDMLVEQLELRYPAPVEVAK